MAFLIKVDYQPMRVVHEGGECKYFPRQGRGFNGFPALFWRTGEFFTAANLFALSKHEGLASPATVHSLMGHLYKYCEFLEGNSLDWRHFPLQKSERVLHVFRGFLIEARDSGLLSPSTVTARMRAVIQFYRFALGHRLFASLEPLWKEQRAYVNYLDSVGFRKSKAVVTTELAIRNRKQHGTMLEDGLLPLSSSHRDELLRFLKTCDGISQEVYLILLLGFFTGARISTIATLHIEALHHARPDVRVPGLFRVAVGPGTGIKTKFDVSGELLMPAWLRDELMRYAASVRRKKREVHATPACKDLLFLTKFGRRFVNLNAEMFKLRRLAAQGGLAFMERFKFHQTRATFGTELMAMALQKASVRAAIAFVRDAMFHKHESTTFRYVKFIQESPIKAALADEFTRFFMGVIPGGGESDA